MAHLFASQEWIDGLWARLRGDDKLRDAGASWAYGPLLLVIDAAPDAGVAASISVKLDVHEGEVRDMRLAESHSEQLAPFVIAGPFAKWKALVTSDSDLYDAILSGGFRTKADLPTLARHRGLLARVVANANLHPTDWPDDLAASAREGEPAGAGRS